MAQRNVYTEQNSFSLSRPNNSLVTFDFNTDPSRPNMTRITLPQRSTWTPEPHWHEQYTEYFRVIKGRVLLKLDGRSKIITPEDGDQVVDRFVVHEFMRADVVGDNKDDGDVVTEEWSDPDDGAKQVFFRNLLGVIQDAETYWKSWTMLQVLLILSRYDNFNVLVEGRMSYLVTHTVYAISEFVAKIVGLRPWYEEYTPMSLRQVAAGKAKSN